jgi:hypothetical protein
MLIERFRSLAAAYGADLARWPENERGEAQIFLQTSAQACLYLREAGGLDELITQATERERTAHGTEEQEMALGRLRSTVAAQISRSARQGNPRASRLPPRLLGAMRETRLVRLGALGLAASGALSFAAGLIIGWTCTSRPMSADPISVLETASIRILTSEYE